MGLNLQPLIQGAVLKALSTRPIIAADVGYKGTQLKMSLYLEGKQRTAFKPKWYSRDYVITDSPVSGADRHNGEIAAFHLGRILGFRRTPLVSGRRVNMNTDIKPVGTKTLLDTFYMQDGNVCFYGRCYYCKGKDTGVCGEGDILEGTVVLWMPSHFQLKVRKHPWSRTYREGKLALWETDDGYCRKVQGIEFYRNGPILLDIIDTAIFDYLVGNADRHHYETFHNASQTMLLLLDNGKSFGNPYHDERSILAPLYQCCSVRVKTWEVLLSLQDGILGSVLKGVLQSDPIAPVLTDYHYTALDRRLQIILKEIEQCMKIFGMKVIVTS
ncbi:hypothetical protein LOTGIDRAFT_213698 [Lottia gigantea]|uniref:FAM20 C-terminal domain-containing protein n=1 Tax=Lottia gigantea TaxID=225164 RepID=V4AVA6_LOTGI|nr:hypothetical protein LOTGIDRAFT_213698 [Lottia gigantea]ESO98910.1 hypothetical protein LOTGIDRAFT_213698 [Lottia gigantea]